MNFVKCSICKVCTHRECVMINPSPDFNYKQDFVCYACAAVGKTFQAVDKHLSNNFYEIKQEKRPTECSLCNVSHGLHAMFPLFDYHGKGARQICYPVQDGGTKMVLAWGHALCALTLANAGHLYACYKDGDYLGMEDDDNEVDMRPPNPESVITEAFQIMYGDAMPHYRYYLTPIDRPPCDWTKAVIDRKRSLECVECKSDDRKSMRIPVQCVANHPSEYIGHKKIHGEEDPCKAALHVGCARWGFRGKQPTVEQVYYFPGIVNDDGSIKSNYDTVMGVYCKSHALKLDKERKFKAKQIPVVEDKNTNTSRRNTINKSDDMYASDSLGDSDDMSKTDVIGRKRKKNINCTDAVVSDTKIKENRRYKWSELFIGQQFCLRSKFTLDKWEFDEKL